MARTWKKGEHFTYRAGTERVFGTVTLVGSKVAFDLFMAGDEKGTATEVEPADTATWQAISEELFQKAEDAAFSPDETAFQADLKLEKMTVRRA